MALYQGLEVIIDWLEFTVMDTSLKDVIDRPCDDYGTRLQTVLRE